MSIKTKKAIVVISVVALFVLLSLVYTYKDPSYSGLFPKCPSLMLTGYRCAGCGTQRAIHHLLNLEIATAFKMNPLFVLMLPLIMLMAWLTYFKGSKRAPKLDRLINNRYVTIAILIIFIVYTITRNIFDY